MSLHLVVLLWLLTGSSGDSNKNAVESEKPKSSSRLALSVTDEGDFAKDLTIPGASSGNRLVVEPSASYKIGAWTAAAQLATITASATGTHTQVEVRELYTSVSLGEFDLTAGKRLLRWGTGYAFTATGVLDPPRRLADPADRLNLNQGREMVKADWTGDGKSISVVWASAGLPFENRTGLSDTSAVRYNVLFNGFDTSVIVAHDGGGATTLGTNFTRVFGESVELHGELAYREGAAVLIGGKYICSPGITILAEYFTPPNTPYFRSAFLSPTAGRPHYAFVRAGKTRLLERPGLKDLDLAVSVVSNLNDRSRVLVGEGVQRLGNRMALMFYGQFPYGAKNETEYGRIPYSALVSVGIRYQR